MDSISKEAIIKLYIKLSFSTLSTLSQTLSEYKPPNYIIISRVLDTFYGVDSFLETLFKKEDETFNELQKAMNDEVASFLDKADKTDQG